MSHHVQITCTMCELTLMLQAGGDGGGMTDIGDLAAEPRCFVIHKH